MKNYIFVTGAPGSRWSGVSQVFRTLPNVDNSDQTADKEYSHHKYSGHVGNYYGPGLNDGTFLDLGFSTRDHWINLINRTFNDDPNKIKIILSHHFAYCLNQITEEFPESPIVLCYRGNEECFEWWHEAGGWDILYPDYSWYLDDRTMANEIVKQNAAIKQFIKTNNLVLEQPYKDLFRKYFNIDQDFIFEPEVQVAIYKPNLIQCRI